MALTSGAKKFLGLLATVAVVGGGIFAFKSGAIPSIKSSAPTEIAVQAPVQEAPVQIQEAPVQVAAPAPVQQANDASTNRGLAAVLGAGNRK